ncbi:hypothetical protein JL722_12451 [Aureococcus anophagefferens]|nr:hypothetical protein JL722_12451 [Aureococcus anophagefferens]
MTSELERAAQRCGVCGAEPYLDAAKNEMLCAACECRGATVGGLGFLALDDRGSRVKLYGADWSEDAAALGADLERGVAWSVLKDVVDGATLAQPREVGYEASGAALGVTYDYEHLKAPLVPRPFSRGVERLAPPSHVSWHSDEDAPLYGDAPVIASVSFGAAPSRCADAAARMVRYDLGGGALLVMAGATQTHWEHAVLKEGGAGETRQRDDAWRAGSVVCCALRCAAPARTVLFCSGNAGDIGGAVAFGRTLFRALPRTDVVCFDYSGFGRSPGAPSEAQTYRDAAGRRLAPTASSAPLVLFGHSMGASVALHHAVHASGGVAALVLDSPPASILHAVSSGTLASPAVVFSPLDPYPNASSIARLGAPVFFVAGDADPICPPANALRLHAAAPLAASRLEPPFVVRGGDARRVAPREMATRLRWFRARAVAARSGSSSGRARAHAATTCWICAASDERGRRRGLVIASAPSPTASAARSRRRSGGFGGPLGGATLLGSVGALALSFASVGDVLRGSGGSPREVAVDFAFVESSIYAAVLIAPALSGLAAQRLGIPAAFLLAAGFAVVALVVCASMEETLAPKPPPAPWSAALVLRRSPLGAVLHFAETRDRRVVGLACFLHWLAMRGFEFLLPLVLKGLFHFSSAQQGFVGSFSGAGAVASSVVLVRAITGDDVSLFKKFAAIGAAGLLLVAASGALAPRRVVVFVAGAALYAMEAPANPALRAMVVDLRGDDDGLGFVLGPPRSSRRRQFVAAVVFGKVYAAMPGTTGFACAAAAMAPLQVRSRPPALRRGAVALAAGADDDATLSPKSPMAGMVLLGGTEPAFWSDLNEETREGTFVCAKDGCNAPLFPSETKYDSGTGWPSFWAAGKDAITVDDGGFLSAMFGREVKCASCAGHLGHRFDDGPINTTGKRFCINGALASRGPGIALPCEDAAPSS